MVDVVQIIFYLICIGVMLLVGNVMWVSRNLLKRQLEQIELEIQKIKPKSEE